MIYSHVPNRGGRGVRSPLEGGVALFNYAAEGKAV